MQWHLLNQLCVNLDFVNSKISVFEEVVSSELQLVQLLVSGMASHQTMSLEHRLVDYNQIVHIEEFQP